MVDTVIGQEKYDGGLFRIALPDTYGRFGIPRTQGATAHQFAYMLPTMDLKAHFKCRSMPQGNRFKR
jgi:hypothetical protein